MRVIITGAGGGIGLAVAAKLAVAGHSLLLADRNRARGEQNAARLRAGGAEVALAVVDMTDPEVGRLLTAAAVEAFGGIDALVHAAGTIAPRAPLAELSLADYEAGFEVNTRPLFLLAQAAYPQLKANRGAIVAVASTGARHPVPDLGSYSPSKAALVMLARQLALEWGPEGVRVNCVSPGPTATAMAHAYADPVIRARRAATIPLRRIGEPEEVADTIAFLLSPAARQITGIDLEIDGGIGLTTMQLSGAALGRGES